MRGRLRSIQEREDARLAMALAARDAAQQRHLAERRVAAQRDERIARALQARRREAGRREANRRAMRRGTELAMLQGVYDAINGRLGRRVHGMALQHRDLGPDDYDMLRQLDERPNQGASAREIDVLPTRVVQEGQDLGDCCICLERMAEGNEVTTLCCFHVFHSGCIRRWLETKAQCPICKAGMDGAAAPQGTS